MSRNGSVYSLWVSADADHWGFSGRCAGYPILGHGGTGLGYRSLLTLVPSRQVGVFTVMTGGDSGYALRGSLHAFLMDQALGLQPWLNESTLCSFPAPWHPPPPPPPPRPTDPRLLWRAT